MGKKLKGAKLRSKKRSAEAVEELQEKQAEAAFSKAVPSEDLFVLDTVGETVPHHKRPSRQDKNKKKFQKNVGLGPIEQKKVDQLREKYTLEELQNAASKGRKLLEEQKRPEAARITNTITANRTRSDFDLWEDDNCKNNINSDSKEVKLTENKKLPADIKQQSVAVDIAKMGQSYLPDPVAHRSLLLQAAAVEITRQKRKKDMDTPLSQGMSKETKALLLGDSDDESDPECNENGDDTMAPVGAIPKRANKLTRAQRNKKKRQRVEQAILEKSKREKKLLKQVGAIPVFKKEIKVKEQQQELQQEEKKKRKLNQPVPGKDVEFTAAARDPIYAPLVPVSLQVGDSLRRLTPKGNPVMDRVHSMALRQKVILPKRDHDSEQRRRASHKRRKLSVKGRHNSDTAGKDFQLLG